MPAAPLPVAPEPPAGVDPVTWWTGQKHSSVAPVAAPLLVAALRRLFALSPGSLATHDVEDLDKGRATFDRLRAAASWNAIHPVRVRPFLYRLRDVGYVLRAVGLTPSVVHSTRVALAIPAQADDETLLAVAHLAAVTCFDPVDLARLYRRDGWTAADLTAWSIRYDFARFEAVTNGGYGWAELGQLLREDNVPSLAQIEFVAALLAPAASPLDDTA